MKDKMQKTPDKTEEKENSNVKNEITPDKIEENVSIVNEKNSDAVEELVSEENEKAPEAEKVKNNTTPLKEKIKIECEFKTPEKSHPNSGNHSVRNSNKTPEKNTGDYDLTLEPVAPSEGDDGMISTTEQARLLIAASKTPSKSLHKTPVKQSTPSGKRSLQNSPATPGKYRRVELITLESPKAKRLKQM